MGLGLRSIACEVADRAVACSSCRMWGLRETPIIPDNYPCGKCTQLQLLEDRVRELEPELDALRTIRDAEHILDKSFSEVVTPKVQAESSWVTT
eukprot:g18203.t1